MSLVYLDASALVKLVLSEAETAELERTVSRAGERVSSAVASTEVRRAVRATTTDPVYHERAEGIIRATSLIAVESALLRAAGLVGPRSLRSLDAIHLATALSLGDELDVVVVYDRRLADAVRGAGLRVIAPGVDPA